MKRLIFFSLIAVWASMALAHDFYVDGIYYVKNSDGNTVSVSYMGTSPGQYSNEYSGSVNIPPSVTYSGKTYDVTSIGYGAFYGCSGLTSVTIPNSVTSIGDYAFYGCSGLTSVTIPNSVTSIGNHSFQNCSGLTSVTIGNSVTSIGNYAFYGCRCIEVLNIDNNKFASISSFSYSRETIKTLILGNSVTTVGNEAFKDCSGLTSVTIPNSVTEIGYEAFYGCSGLTKVEISDLAAWCKISFGSNPLSYAKHLYLNGSEIKDLVIPNSVTSIGGGAFYGCSGLTSVTIPNSVTSIGQSAFSGCSGLKTVNWNAVNCTVPTTVEDEYYTRYAPFYNLLNIITFNFGNEVKKIPDGLCDGLSGLTSVEIGNSVTEIGNSAFSRCSGLTSVTIGNSVASIGTSAFNGCSGLTKVEISDLAAWCGISFGDNPLSYAHHLYLNGSEIKDLVIPNSVTSIGNYAFSGCSGLTSVTIPNSIIKIGVSAFEGCDNVQTLTWNANNCTSMGNMPKTNISSVTIGNSVETLPNGFVQNSKITSVSIPNSVTSIGSSAFYGCSGLTSIEIPNSVTSIGDGAFSGCSGLTSIEIPNSVTSIWDNAFFGCVGLKKVEISDIEAWCNIAFNNGDANPLSCAKHLYLNESEITNLVIPSSISSVRNYTFHNCNGFSSVTIPNSVTSIGSYAFEGCGNIQNLAWNAKNCTSMGNMPKSMISTVSIGEGVETLPNGFVQNSKITSVSIPNSVTSIGNSAFYGCSGLTSVTIGNSVTSIGNSAFSGCSKIDHLSWVAKNCTSMGNMPKSMITTLSIGEGVETLPTEFVKGSKITSVTIPNSVTTIGASAFVGCNIQNLEWNAKNCASMGDMPKTNISTVTIGNSVETLPKNFVENSKITDVTIPNSVTTIGSNAFSGCAGLTSVAFGNSIASIGESAFINCSGLTAGLILPNSLNTIGASAFSGCSGLPSVEIPNAVSSIGDSAFSDCRLLQHVTIGSNASAIGDNAFKNCKYLVDVTNYSVIPQEINANVFDGVDLSLCYLYVLENSYDYYIREAVWKDFNVRVAGVEGVEVDLATKEVEGYYDLKGIRLEEPIRGQVNIVRYKDGTLQKVIMR